MMTMAPQEQPADSSVPVEPMAPAQPALERPAGEARPSVADGVEHALDSRSVTLQRIVGWIIAAPILASLLLALVLVLVLADLLIWAGAVLFLFCTAPSLALAWIAHRWPEIQHRHAAYKVDARGIEIRRGVVWRKVINVPRSRIQHTDVSQGPLERVHGLATLIIYTAGTDHARVDLHGLDHATALAIRDHLLAGEGDDAV